MSEWKIDYTEDAKTDLNKLDHSVAVQVVKGIRRVSINPLPQSAGGYGKPLGNKNGSNLSGFLKIKFLKLGIRVVYRLIPTQESMRVIIISIRSDDEVYLEASRRIKSMNDSEK